MPLCLKFTGSVAPGMGVAEPLRRPTASRGRKRPRAAARLVGTSRAACCRSRLRVNPFLFWFVSFWLLFSGVWETYPLPGHRLVPESQELYVIHVPCLPAQEPSALGFLCARGRMEGRCKCRCGCKWTWTGQRVLGSVLGRFQVWCCALLQALCPARTLVM